MTSLSRNVWCDPGFQCKLTERLDTFAATIIPETSQLFQNQVWIDALGSDDTGEINNPELPFETGNAASAALTAAAVAGNVAFHFGIGTSWTLTYVPDGGALSIFGAGATGTTVTMTPGAAITVVSDGSVTVNMVAAANAITSRGVNYGTYSATDGTVSQTMTRCVVNSMTGSFSLVATDSQLETVTATTGSTLTLVNVRGGTWSWTATPALTMSMLNCVFSTSIAITATVAGLTGNLAVLQDFRTPSATFTIDANDVIKIVNPSITNTFVITTASSVISTFGGATKVRTGSGTHTNNGALTAVYS